MSTLLPVDDRFERLAVALSDPHERHAMETMLPAYLRTQRWFGGQARSVTHATFAAWLDLGREADGCLCLVDVSDADGVTTRHQLYLGVSKSDGNPAVLDALELPEVREFLGDLALRGVRVEGDGLALSGRRAGGQDASVAGMESHLLGVEQSNSSIVFGGTYILKLYRRLEPGPHPDVELLSALEAAGFQSAPALFGSATLTCEDGFAATAMTLQAFVPNEGDGWEWGVECARRAIEACESPGELEHWLSDDEGSLQGARSLGQTTGAMHAALAMATGPDTAPEAFTVDHLAALEDEIRREAIATTAMVAAALPGDTTTAAAIDALKTLQAPAAPQLGLRTRIHGDYHLGQVLRSSGGFVVTDFEGEPARPLAERRQRQSPLADVAGMVRSFDYAGQAALRARPAGANEDELATRWSEAMAGEFLRAYWQAAESSQVAFLPPPEARVQLLRLFELRKALYELRYELNNRPDWVQIPVASIIRLGAALV